MPNIKFELTEPGKQFSNKELLDDINRVAKKIGQSSVSIREYFTYGKYSPQTPKKRFGSWKNAIRAAGLEESKRVWGGGLEETAIPEKNLLEDLKRVSKLLDKQSLTLKDYSEHGKFSTSAISKRWGGWNQAKRKAELSIGRVYNSTDEDYFLNLANVWQKLGRQPKYQEVVAPLSKLHISSYERKYGSWRNALESFVAYMNGKGSDKIEKQVKLFEKVKKTPRKISKKEKLPVLIIKKRTNRIANLRQRFRVMKRDEFKCVLCGTSPANNPGLELHIDHIVPWSMGGETVEENLRTLCSTCNLGRSNKE